MAPVERFEFLQSQRTRLGTLSRFGNVVELLRHFRGMPLGHRTQCFYQDGIRRRVTPRVSAQLEKEGIGQGVVRIHRRVGEKESPRRGSILASRPPCGGGPREWSVGFAKPPPE